MHIVYAADNNFAEILGVSLVSLFENNRSTHNIQVYIIDNGISKINKERLKNVFEKYGRNLPVWLQTKNINTVLGISVQTDRGSLSQYSRLFVSSLLPDNIEKILYFDCDIIINASIEELWNMNMNGKTIAVLQDAFSRQYRKNIGLSPEALMFNSGVMLIDLNRWKEKNIEKKLMNFIKNCYGQIQQGDQGALNAVLSDDAWCFPPKFNSVTIFYDFSYEEMLIYRKPPAFYSKNEVKNAVEHPVIIHYTTSFLSKRPWVQGSSHKYRDKWLYYKSISPWREEPLKLQKEKKIKKVYLYFYRFMPKRFSIRFAGILQAYGRPFLYAVKNYTRSKA